MRFQRRRGVSVLVATLLLVAISVSAAIITYVFVGGVAGQLTRNGGQSVTEKLTIQSFNFQLNPGSCACSEQIVEIFLLNPGPATTTISAVYYNGILVTAGPGMNGVGTFPTTAGTQFAISTNAYTWFAATSASTVTSTTAGDIYFGNTAAVQQTYTTTQVGQVVITLSSAATYGAGNTVKVVSTTGAQNVFTVEGGISG